METSVYLFVERTHITMSLAFDGIIQKNMCVYLDGAIIFTKTEEEMMETLRIIFERLRKYHIK
jgi:hypothetical protein